MKSSLQAGTGGIGKGATRGITGSQSSAAASGGTRTAPLDHGPACVGGQQGTGSTPGITARRPHCCNQVRSRPHPEQRASGVPPPRAGQDPSLRSASQLTFSHGTHGASSTFVLLKPDPVYNRIAAALLGSQWRPGEEWRRSTHEKALACHRGTGHNFCPLHGTQLTHGSAAPRCCQLLRSHKRPARHALPASARHHGHVAQIGYACVCSQAATRQ